MFSKPLQLQKATGTSHFSMRTATALSAHSLQFFRAVDKDTGAAGRGTCTRTRTLLSPVCVRRPPPHRPPFTLSFSLPSVWLSGLRTPDSGLSTRTHFHSLKPLACYLAIELITDTTSVPTLDCLSPESWSLHSLFFIFGFDLLETPSGDLQQMLQSGGCHLLPYFIAVLYLRWSVV